MLRRFVPLMGLLGLSLLVLIARLWDIQVVQHRTWSTEAVNLVRDQSVTPYVRGSLRDRQGRLITRDEEIYALEFVWRDFRRGHPLGQVAMMRSLMLMRPVGLDEARPSIRQAALCYASLSPDAIEAFALGGELDAVIDFVPAVAGTSQREIAERARAERRWPRAGDLRYYIQRLLRLTPRQIKEVGVRIEGGMGDRSYLELAAAVRDQTVQEATEILETGVLQADMNLSRLAPLIDWSGTVMEPGEGVMAAGDLLVPLIEERRRAVDDDTADALFRIAAGFSSMKLDRRNLERLDLRWLRAALDWDERRLEEWQERRGEAFRDAALGWMAGTMIARSKIGREKRWPGDRVVAAFAHGFRKDADAWSRENAAAQDWRQVDVLDVVQELPRRLEAREGLPEALVQAPVFAFQTDALRGAGFEGADLVLAAFKDILGRESRSPTLPGVPVGKTPEELAAQLVRVADRSAREWGPDDEALFAALLLGGHEQLQLRVAQILDAAEEGGAQRFGLPFGEAFVEKALETRRYAIRDRGARPKVVGGEPSTDLVLLVTRYSEDFAGFRVTSKTRRVPIAKGPDGGPLAPQLVGAVRSPFLVEVMQRAPDREELSDLQRKHTLNPEDRPRILSLLDAAFVAAKSIGGAGLEAWFDKELSGTVGYREVQGLQDRIDGNRDPISREKVDGKDVTLTLDIDLQWAAEDVLQHPESPPASDRRVDDLWFQYPVGAIVLTTVDGEILAAASVPVRPNQPVGPPVTDGERAHAIDRTLVRPRGQAPGSVVKPLLAAYALEHLGLDPTIGLEYCDPGRPREGQSPKDSDYPGFGVVNCNVRYGHSPQARFGGRPLTLMESLMVSCNVYFAALGERYFDAAKMRDAYTTFGFGEPTGVRFDDNGERSGITDSYWHNPKSPLHESTPESTPGLVDCQYLGNGLVHVDANVVQMARAYAGLATGSLPRMSLVKRVGEEIIEGSAEPIEIGAEHFDFVREALHRVVNDPTGTAHGKGLGEKELGFVFAAKTGSADYRPGLCPPTAKMRGAPLDSYTEGMRKHTWVAGWFPAAEPEFVLVVYLHDTAATASHSAVYVAGQFLRRPEVKSLMEEHLAAQAEAARPESPASEPSEAPAEKR